MLRLRGSLSRRMATYCGHNNAPAQYALKERNVMAFRQGPPKGGVECRWPIGTNRDRRRYSWLSINEVLDLRSTSATVYHTYSDASAKLYLSQPAACTTTTKRREKNRICLYAAINLKRNLECARCMYCTIEVTDRHEASHGLSATAELLVYD